jgi:hypothetical protein
MPATVKIQEIVDALETEGEESANYLDPENGEVYFITDEMMRQAEGTSSYDSDPPEWALPHIEIAEQILETGRLLRLPTPHDVHEWAIMRDFAEEPEQGSIRGELLEALHGRGAFRTFKNIVYRRKIEKRWYAYKAEALREIAIAWCERHGLAWE